MRGLQPEATDVRDASGAEEAVVRRLCDKTRGRDRHRQQEVRDVPNMQENGQRPKRTRLMKSQDAFFEILQILVSSDPSTIP